MPPFEAVIHPAGRVGGSLQSWGDDRGGYIEDNALAALSVALYARRTGAHVVYLTTEPGESPYHYGKWIAALVLAEGAQSLTVLHLTNAYGRGMRRGLFRSLLDQYAGGSEYWWIHSRAPRRNWLWVEDAVEAVLIAARERLVGQFTLAGKDTVTVGEILDLVLARVGHRHVEETGTQPNETLDVTADWHPLARALGAVWEPRVGLEAGIAELFAHTASGSAPVLRFPSNPTRNPTRNPAREWAIPPRPRQG